MRFWKFFAFALLAICFVQTSSAQNNPLENASIRQLVTLVDANETYTQFAVDVFARKFSAMWVSIEDPEEENHGHPIYVRYNVINVHHIESGMRLLKFFGHLISKLTFTYRSGYLSGTDPRELTKYINLYCSATLEELRIYNRDENYENLWKDMTKPFHAVEDLMINGEYKTLASPSLSLGELFPAIRRLDMTPYKLIDKESIEQTFPQLEHLTLVTSQRDVLDSDFEKLLRMNPHIQGLRLYSSSPAFLYTVHEILPNITHLALITYNSNYEPSNRDIIFEHVTKFELETSNPPPMNIKFTNLTEFTVNLYQIREDFITLIEQNPHLEILHMNGGHMNGEQLNKIIDLELKLHKVKLYLESTNTDTIMSFARQMRRTVNEMVFASNRYSDSVEIRGMEWPMKREFGDDFDVQVIHLPIQGISLKRRN